MRVPFLIAGLMVATAASADVSVRFIEGAPTDRFVIVSDAACAIGPVTVSIDLEGSAGGLILDVTEAGQGVEVYQPLTLRAGAEQVVGVSEVSDGATNIFLDLRGLSEGLEVSFTLDLDDTMGGREITVSGSEIAGATASITTPMGSESAVFDATATALIPVAACTS